ncbi:MAG: RluA family pseudouridine synthase [Bacteroidota bacterium]
MKNRKSYIHNVPDDLAIAMRLRVYLKGVFPHLETGNSVKKAIKKELIRLNGEIGQTGDWVHAGDQISYERLIPEKRNNLEKEDFDIYYEDEYLMILRKAAGIASSGNTRSLQSRLENIEIELSKYSLPYPYLVHRLDRATEGLIIAAKSIHARRELEVMLSNHEIEKRYVLIVSGKMMKSLKWITEAIDGKPAKTEILDIIYLDTKDPTTKVTVQLHTGRTHQIRRHFSGIGHPLIGDQLYNKSGLTFGTGLLLCANYLKFEHPISKKELEVVYPLPKKISKFKPEK